MHPFCSTHSFDHEKALDLLSRPEFENASDTAETACSVSELNRRARLLLEGGIGLVRVRGEISGFTRATSGHVYFSLKDANAQVRCALWRGKASALAFEPKNGDAVDVRASVTLFEARGEYQLSIETMRRAGAGALFEQLLRLKEKLAAEGLFDAGRKRALPSMPIGIGIVTSLQAAALHDVLTTLARRAPMIPVVLYPAPVQGEGSAGTIARAIATASARATQDRVDVLIVCRGGGSIEDLWSFNEESVARAIADCAIPVVSGVGHETDFTIADWVADMRAPTPTAAAELVSPDLADMYARLAGVAAVLRGAIAYRLGALQQRIDWVARGLNAPDAYLARQRQRLLRAREHLESAVRGSLSAKRMRAAHGQARLRAPALAGRQIQLVHAKNRLSGAAAGVLSSQRALVERSAAALQILNPQRVLERGFAVVQNARGEVVCNSSLLSVGDVLDIRFAQGRTQAVVGRNHDEDMP